MKTAFRFGLAGLLHDIGKFSQRAQVELTPETRRLREMCRHTPLADRPWSYEHALHTNQFLHDEQVSEIIRLHDSSAGAPGDPSAQESIADLASWHHNPTTPGQWIIAEADRLSAGFDRVERETGDEAGGPTDYRTTYLRALFQAISTKETEPAESARLTDHGYRYPLVPFDPPGQETFPKERSRLRRNSGVCGRIS